MGPPTLRLGLDRLEAGRPPLARTGTGAPSPSGMLQGASASYQVGAVQLRGEGSRRAAGETPREQTRWALGYLPRRYSGLRQQNPAPPVPDICLPPGRAPASIPRMKGQTRMGRCRRGGFLSRAWERRLPLATGYAILARMQYRGRVPQKGAAMDKPLPGQTLCKRVRGGLRPVGRRVRAGTRRPVRASRRDPAPDTAYDPPPLCYSNRTLLDLSDSISCRALAPSDAGERHRPMPPPLRLDTMADRHATPAEEHPGGEFV